MTFDLVVLAVLSLASLVVLAWHSLKSQSRLLRTIDDLSTQVVALKNPYAAQAFTAAKQAATAEAVANVIAKEAGAATPADEETWG
jgi:hypothetical protein